MFFLPRTLRYAFVKLYPYLLVTLHWMTMASLTVMFVYVSIFLVAVLRGSSASSATNNESIPCYTPSCTHEGTFWGCRFQICVESDYGKMTRGNMIIDKQIGPEGYQIFINFFIPKVHNSLLQSLHCDWLVKHIYSFIKSQVTYHTCYNQSTGYAKYGPLVQHSG